MNVDNKKKILVVDDEKDVCTYLATLLKDNGFDVLIATNGKEAVDIALKNNPDLISLDITMPEELSPQKIFPETTSFHSPYIVYGLEPGHSNSPHKYSISQL